MWPNPLETADLVTFTGKILNEKLHYLRSAIYLVELLKSPALLPTFVTKRKQPTQRIYQED